jgi:hypothetical protein
MDLKVNYNNVANKDEAYEEALKQITPEYIAKWKIKADISYDKDKGEIKAVGKGFKLGLSFSEDQCKVDLDLSFLLKPLRGTVLEAVESKLKKHL